MKGRVEAGTFPVSGHHVVDIVLTPRRLVLCRPDGTQHRYQTADEARAAAAAASDRDITHTLLTNGIGGIRPEEIAR